MTISTESLRRIRASRIAVSVLFFCAGFCFSGWASRIPDIQQKLKLNEAGLGMTLLSLPIGLVISLPVSGFLVSRYGSRGVAVLAAALYAFLLPFLGLATAVWQLVIVLFLFGFAGNLLNISMNTQGVNVEGYYGRSIMASFHGVWSVAGFCGAAVGTLMRWLILSPFYHFCIVAIFIFLLVGLVYQYLTSADIHSGANAPVFVKPDGKLLKLGLIAFCCMVCEGTMFDWSGIYFARAVEAPQSLVTIGYVAFMTAMAAGRFAGDWLATTMGKKNMIRVSGILIFLGMMLSVSLPYLIPATIGFLIIGMGVSSVVPIVYGVAGRSEKMASGVALAAVSTIGYMGFLFGPPVIGLTAQAFNLRWSFTLIAFLGLGTTLLAGMSKIRN